MSRHPPIAGGGGGGWTVLDEQTLLADAQTLSFSETFNSYSEVLLRVWAPEQASGHNITVRVNGSAVGVSYNRMQHTSASVAAGGATEAAFCVAGGASVIVARLPLAESGRRRHMHVYTSADGGASANLESYAQVVWNNVAAITQLELVSSLATGFKAGTYAVIEGRA